MKLYFYALCGLLKKGSFFTFNDSSFEIKFHCSVENIGVRVVDGH